MYVINLRELSRKNINLVGGKGANLGELLRKKFLVPSGFVISTIAYERYLSSNGIYITEDEKDNYLEIRKYIKEGTFPEDMLNEIKKAYEKLGENARVAVRTSPTAEDLLDTSFAGQQETYLNVQSFEDVLTRIKDCFASCFTYKSVRYRKDVGYGFSEIKAAVVVQEMIEAEVSGILFTANILDGDRKEMLVSASYGLGKSGVLDIISSDKYILNQTGKVNKKYIGKKDKKIVYGDKEVIEVDVEEEKRNECVLNEEQLNRLYRIGKRIEKICMNYVDIEWVLKDNKFYILQSRSMTSIKSNMFDDLTFQKNKKYLSKKQKKRLAVVLGHTPYVFYPLDFHLAQLVGNSRKGVLGDVGIEIGENFIIDNKGIVSLTTPKTKINTNIFKCLNGFKSFFYVKNNKVYGKKALDECKKEFYNIENKCAEDMTLRERAIIFVKLANLLEKIGSTRFKYFIIPMMISRKLNFHFRNKKNISEAYFEKTPYCMSKINYEIKKLIKSISEDEDNRDKKIDEFLEKYGCESDYSYYPFSSISWLESKEEFCDVLDLFYKRQDIYNKETNNQRGNTENFLNFCEYNVYQEEMKYLWERCNLLLRKNLKHISKTLNTDIKDLWFLFFYELLEVCNRGFLSEEDNKNINLRKFYREEAELKWKDLFELISDVDESNNILTGINASYGIKRGRACLVLEKEDLFKLKSGDIMICKHIPPEWIPIFSIASAVVSDTGGILSHSTSIAREYKIPLVLATGNATSRIHDGDEILVNGSRGIVSFC